jgi:cytochrome c-type biogenesis protein CcmH/NrfG
MAAQAVWQKAARIDPSRVDCASYLGLVRARIDDADPERVEAEFATVLSGLADRPLHADVLSTLGDVYMRAGRMAEARLWYARSFDLINVPEIKNYRAQKGLGGL